MASSTQTPNDADLCPVLGVRRPTSGVDLLWPAIDWDPEESETGGGEQGEAHRLRRVYILGLHEVIGVEPDEVVGAWPHGEEFTPNPQSGPAYLEALRTVGNNKLLSRSAARGTRKNSEEMTENKPVSADRSVETPSPSLDLHALRPGDRVQIEICDGSITTYGQAMVTGNHPGAAVIDVRWLYERADVRQKKNWQWPKGYTFVDSNDTHDGVSWGAIRAKIEGADDIAPTTEAIWKVSSVKRKRDADYRQGRLNPS